MHAGLPGPCGAAYNLRMNPNHSLPRWLRTPLAWGLLAAAGGAMAQSPAAPAPQPSAPAAADVSTHAAAGERPQPTVERIRHEDALTRVDEVRVGEQTRSITVQPKVGAPAYEVTPVGAGEDTSAARNSSSGRSRWRLLDF